MFVPIHTSNLGHCSTESLFTQMRSTDENNSTQFLVNLKRYNLIDLSFNFSENLHLEKSIEKSTFYTSFVTQFLLGIDPDLYRSHHNLSFVNFMTVFSFLHSLCSICSVIVLLIHVCGTWDDHRWEPVHQYWSLYYVYPDHVTYLSLPVYPDHVTYFSLPV